MVDPLHIGLVNGITDHCGLAFHFRYSHPALIMDIKMLHQSAQRCATSGEFVSRNPGRPRLEGWANIPASKPKCGH